MPDKQKKPEKGTAHEVGSSELLAELLEKWKKRKEDYFNSHGNCYGEDKTYHAGLSDELRSCILEFEELLEVVENGTG